MTHYPPGPRPRPSSLELPETIARLRAVRYAQKVDANQSRLVAQLRQVGATVEPRLAQVGSGCPDLLVGFRGKNYLFEVKDPDKVPSARKLTPKEVDWHKAWGGQVAVVETLEDCLDVLGASTTEAF